MAIAIALVYWVQQLGGPQAVGVYLPGNWPVPYGIVLVVDRLSAMMLVLTSTVALATVLFSAARWHRAGVHFHPLFQFQLMGLAGAFLTADLFNLFVFFEIMLAASYGLLLHGSGRPRVSAGLHYIAINLAASSLFLIGVSILYGITGTLNMADLAQSIAGVAVADRGLLHAAAAILAVAFLIKAAVWPLNFWLVPAYSAATAPVGAQHDQVGVLVLGRGHQRPGRLPVHQERRRDGGAFRARELHRLGQRQPGRIATQDLPDAGIAAEGGDVLGLVAP